MHLNFVYLLSLSVVFTKCWLYFLFYSDLRMVCINVITAAMCHMSTHLKSKSVYINVNSVFKNADWILGEMQAMVMGREFQQFCK